jgi:class 3 adenylate cyclase
METHRQRREVDAVDPADHRAVVRTILFTDVVGSTSYADANGDLSFVRLLDEHDRIVRRAVDTSDGRFVKATGDGAMAAFAEAGVAIEVALVVQRESLARSIPLRVGLDHGPVIEYPDGDCRGLVANIAARLSSMAEAGQVTITDRVARAARLVGPTRPCPIRGVRVCQRVRTLTVDRSLPPGA